MGVLQMTWQPSLLKSQKLKHGGPPLGLRNLGNSCYINSVLQCLTYTPPLANFCLRLLHSSSCDLGASKEKKTDCPFCILEKRITRSLSSEASSDAPLKINSCLRIYADHFRTGRQEDAHEFLRYVIDACHNSCLRLKKLQQRVIKNGFSNGGDNSTGGAGETVVKEIFGGALQSQVKCLSCGAESNKVDEIMDISLEIQQSGSLKEALQKFFQPEILDGSNKYKCENCKELVAARKQLTILEAPNVLVVQLKRFEGMYGVKVDKHLAFEEILVLSSYMCKASQDQHPEYNLFGTIVHSGFSPDSGHYYAYIKDAIGRWYCCNDSYVSVSTLQEVLSEKVYVLFFSRTKQRPQARVNFTANGSKSHESNCNKTPTIQKIGCVEKKVFTNTSSKLIESNGHKTENNNNSTNLIESNDIKTSTIEKSGCVKAQVDKKDVLDLHSEDNISPTASNGFNCSNSNASESNSFIGPANKRQTSNHHGQTNGLTKSKADIDSLEGSFRENNGVKNMMTSSPKDVVSGSSRMKRKREDGNSCILLAKDDQSRAEVEAFKERIEREASSILRSCGWSDDLYDFMHSTKKLCQKDDNSVSSSHDKKSFLISQARQSFLSKVPEALKGRLIEELRNFSQEKQSSRT